MPPAAIMEAIGRKVVLALELIDPVTGRAVTDGIAPMIDDLHPPAVTASNRFVWRANWPLPVRDPNGPPKTRQVEVKLNVKNPQFTPVTSLIQVSIPDDDGTSAPAALFRQEVLRTTALYQPPAGTMAVIGTLQEGNGSTAPVVGAQITIDVNHSGGTGEHQSGHTAITGSNGDFTAILTGLTDEILDPPPDPAPPGTVFGMLRVTTAAVTKMFVIDPPLRPGRTSTLHAPLKWAADSPSP